MPPKQKTKEEKAAEKAAKEKRAKNAEDKTFGLKNKNKSKVVQQQVKQIQQSATAHDKRQKPKEDEKKDNKKALQQQALLAGLFNMAVDKKGRAFDPTAKKKAKEKNMEEERSGANIPDETQKAFAEAIKTAIRMANAKGTNLSTVGGSVYVRDVQGDPKHEKHLKNVTTLHFIRRRKADFWIAEEDADNSNPTIRCQDDVDAENAEDDRDIFLQLEEKRQPFYGDTTLKRVDMQYLKSWWLESARLELRRDPDTGLILEEALLKARMAPPKKMTGEQLFKSNPSLAHAAHHEEGTATATASTAASQTTHEGSPSTRGGAADSDEEEELERDEDVPVGRAWGEVELEVPIEEQRKEAAASSEGQKASVANGTAGEEWDDRPFGNALAGLPADLGDLESVSEEDA
ncbi:unnamed protein product [Amoebophrya sp. A25]|nr:unnamed protein product [Amoebophrya sp. A25]|eukprot:GSA25T00012513001.1